LSVDRLDSYFSLLLLGKIDILRAWGASVVVLVPVRGVCAVEGLYFLRDFLYFFG
jgi:hypothetical protein